MTPDNISYLGTVVEHLSANRTAGLLYPLHYTLHHQHAQGWIAPLTILRQRGRRGQEVPHG
jgi:hypothetical protein